MANLTLGQNKDCPPQFAEASVAGYSNVNRVELELLCTRNVSDQVYTNKWRVKLRVVGNVVITGCLGVLICAVKASVNRMLKGA